jgi:DNA replication protein DnaC
MLGLVTKTCSACASAFEVVAVVAPVCVVCPCCVEREACEALEAFRAREAAQAAITVEHRLRAIGMGARELEAELQAVPVAIRRALPRLLTQDLIGGDALVADGFGLTGGQGIGKTMCLAAMVRARATALHARALSACRVAPADGDASWFRVGVQWVNWPSGAARVKALSVQDHGAAEVAALVRAWAGTPLLVLDDLGRERMRGAYDEDYAFGVLDQVVDARSRESAPVLWTSNLTPAALVSRYGAALPSRLLELAPAVRLSAGPDLRLPT